MSGPAQNGIRGRCLVLVCCRGAGWYPSAGFHPVFFVGFLLLLISSSFQVSTCCNCCKKGNVKGAEGSQGHLAIAGCHPCWCREMEQSLHQGKNPMEGYCRALSWAGHFLPTSSLRDTACSGIEGRDGVCCAALQRAWGFAGPSQSKREQGCLEHSIPWAKLQTQSGEQPQLGLTPRGLDVICVVMLYYKN